MLGTSLILLRTFGLVSCFFKKILEIKRVFGLNFFFANIFRISRNLLAPCLSKYIESQGTLLFDPTLTHINTFAELMQTMNTVALAKFVACCQYQRIICPP